MSGRSFLRALAGRLREALLGRNLSGGTAPCRGAHHATGSQMVTRATGPRETGRAHGGRAAHGTREDGGRAWGWRGAKGEYDGVDKRPYTGGPTKGAYGGDAKGKAPYEAVDKVPYTGGPSKGDAKGKGPYEAVDMGPYTGGPSKGDSGSGGAKTEYSSSGGAGGGDGAKGRRRRRARGKGKSRAGNTRGWWSALTKRITTLQAERARRLTERMQSLSAWVIEGVAAASVAVTVGYNTMVEKLQAGTAVAKDKVLELKEAVKEKLSPGKGSPPKVSVKDGDDEIRPHALDFSP